MEGLENTSEFPIELTIKMRFKNGFDNILLCMVTSATAVIRLLRPEFKFPAKIEMAFSQIIPIVSR